MLYLKMECLPNVERASGDHCFRVVSSGASRGVDRRRRFDGALK
jgi:hypothetical protein